MLEWWFSQYYQVLSFLLCMLTWQILWIVFTNIDILMPENSLLGFVRMITRNISMNFLFFRRILFDICVMTKIVAILIFIVNKSFFFDRNRRSQFLIINQILIKIRSIVWKNNASNYQNLMSFSWGEKEIVFIENVVQYIRVNQILTRRIDMILFKNEFFSSFTFISIRQIYNVLTQKIRFIEFLQSIRAELKIKIFGRDYLIVQLLNKVKSLSMIIFVNEFEFYRNMYRILTDVYAVPAELTINERQKSRNVYIIILSFHESEFNDVINSFRINLKIADCEYIVDICEMKTSMWASVMIWLKNMKQQQMTFGFLFFRIIHSCRYCTADINDRENLFKNVVQHDRYHHQISFIRQKDEQIIQKTKKTIYFKQNDLKKIVCTEKIDFCIEFHHELFFRFSS